MNVVTPKTGEIREVFIPGLKFTGFFALIAFGVLGLHKTSRDHPEAWAAIRGVIASQS